MANFIKINKRPLQSVYSLQMQQKCKRKKNYVLLVFYVSVVEYFASEWVWACVCHRNERFDRLCGCIWFAINNMQVWVVVVAVFLFVMSIFRNGQWKWHAMTYLQIGSNWMSLTITIFMGIRLILLCTMTTILQLLFLSRPLSFSLSLFLSYTWHLTGRRSRNGSLATFCPNDVIYFSSFYAITKLAPPSN